MSQKITLERIDLLTALKFGFALGALLALLGAAFFFVFYMWLLSLLSSSPFFAPSPFNPQPVLPLPGLGVIVTWLLVYVVLGALLYAFVVWLYAVIYNLIASITGGLQFQISSPLAIGNPQLGAAAAATPVFNPPSAPSPSASSYTPLPPANPPANPFPMQPAPMPQTPAPTFQAAPIAQTSPWLVGITNPMLRVELSRPVTRIGSANGNDLVVPSARVAAHHAEIRIENGRYILHDVSNGIGISVNGRAIQGSNMLKNNFQIVLGDMTFVFQQ